MKILNYVKPSSLGEAYEFLGSGGTIIGGGAWLKLMPKTIEYAIDISGLSLEGIQMIDGDIHIGSMTTLRAIESNPLIQNYMDGALSEAASHIMGVTVRNIATIGGSVANRFGFSDIITPLLAVNAGLKFYNHGSMDLEAYLEKPFEGKDILVELILPSSKGRAVYKTLKKTSTDFPIINVAVAQVEGRYRVCVGARPGVAKLAPQAMALLNQATRIDHGLIGQVGNQVGEEIAFGSNSRASEFYRSEVCKALTERCLKEVLL